jgi:predicted naringenin-chalcone synthase
MEKQEQIEQYRALKQAEDAAEESFQQVFEELIPLESRLRLIEALHARDKTGRAVQQFCSQHVHAAVEATRDLLTETGMAPEKIEEVVIQTYAAFQRQEIADRLVA